MTNIQTLFDRQGLTVVITGGSGHLGRVMAHSLAQQGVKVAILSLHNETSEKVAEAIRAEAGQAIGVACDVQAVNNVFNTNFTGTLQSCQVFGRVMAERGQGCIVNITSMSALRPLTRIPAYSSAKAAVSNFTQWLAVYMAQEYSPNIRVNAIAPGFFLTEQNRFLLTDVESGAMTQRGQSILSHTPMNRLGTPADLVGTLMWLVSPATTFISGVVIPVDGGFSSFSGV
jgi:NAD(P)-dependent dehydrogenase (short-subunit alcohol dehydrogenase family)